VENLVNTTLKNWNITNNWNFFFLFRAAPVASVNSQANGRIGAASSSLHHSHSNIGSELHLQSTVKLLAMLDP